MPTTCLNFTKKCGGCPLLAMPYREQLAQKQARLQELLGGFAPVKAVQGMADPLHYRNKAIASFAAQHGKLVCGLYAEGTHKVLPGADCLLQEDILNKTLAAVLDAARTCRWTAYDEDRGTGLLRHTVLRSSADGKVLVTLVTPGPELPGSKNFCAAMRKKAPWVVSIVQNINPTRTSAVLGNREKTLYGPGFVLDTLCGTQFAISSRSFYQVNRTQTEVLYKKALELAKLTGRETVVDAYCGIGTIGLCAAPQAKQVIGVERNPAAVKDAAANARRNKIANGRRRRGPAPGCGVPRPAPRGQHAGVHRRREQDEAAPCRLRQLRPRNPGPRRRRLHPPRLARRQILPGRPLPPDTACGDGMPAGEVRCAKNTSCKVVWRKDDEGSLCGLFQKGHSRCRRRSWWQHYISFL